MNNQKIIDWKIASLANNDNSELSEEMQRYLIKIVNYKKSCYSLNNSGPMRVNPWLCRLTS